MPVKFLMRNLNLRLEKHFNKENWSDNLDPLSGIESGTLEYSCDASQYITDKSETSAGALMWHRGVHLVQYLLMHLRHLNNISKLELNGKIFLFACYTSILHKGRKCLDILAALCCLLHLNQRVENIISPLKIYTHFSQSISRVAL